MPDFSKILGLLKYAPMVIEVIRSARGKSSDAETMAKETQALADELNDYKKSTDKRLDDIEHIQSEMKSRVKDAHASIGMLWILAITAVGLSAIAVIFAVIAVIRT